MRQRESVIERLDTLDHLFLSLESASTPTHVGGVLVFSGDEVDSDTRYERLRRTAVGGPPFNLLLRPARMLGGRPSWEHLPHVDTGSHLHRRALPGPGGAEQLMTIVSELHGAPVDRDRPMWECHLLEGLEGGRYAYYYKVHHACIDGISAIRRMQKGLSADPAEDTLPLWAREPSRRRSRSAERGLRAAAKRLGASAGVVREIAGALRALHRDDDGSPDRAAVPFRAPASPLNETISSGARSVAWQRLSLAEVREIGRAAGATVNEVAVTLIAGVLRKHLAARGHLPDRPLVAQIPVTLRETTSAAASGNRISALLCQMATHVEDPAGRLRSVVASSQDGKRRIRALSKDAAAAYAIVTMVPGIAAMLLGVYERVPLPFNVVISNVPGPRVPLYDNGARLEAIYPVSMLWDRQALNVTMISYLDELDIGLLAAREAVADLPGMARDLSDELALLRHAVLG